MHGIEAELASKKFHQPTEVNDSNLTFRSILNLGGLGVLPGEKVGGFLSKLFHDSRTKSLKAQLNLLI